jgi:hypothetical protein
MNGHTTRTVPHPVRWEVKSHLALSLQGYCSFYSHQSSQNIVDSVSL